MQQGIEKEQKKRTSASAVTVMLRDRVHVLSGFDLSDAGQTVSLLASAFAAAPHYEQPQATPLPETLTVARCCFSSPARILSRRNGKLTSEAQGRKLAPRSCSLSHLEKFRAEHVLDSAAFSASADKKTPCGDFAASHPSTYSIEQRRCFSV